MRRQCIAVFLLCAALGIEVAVADQDSTAGQDKDLDLIPKEAQRQQSSANAQDAAPRAIQGASRLYLENALSVSSLRSELAVAAPAPLPYNWQERLFFDVRKEWRLTSRLGLTYSGRLNFRDENDLSPARQASV